MRFCAYGPEEPQVEEERFVAEEPQQRQQARQDVAGTHDTPHLAQRVQVNAEVPAVCELGVRAEGRARAA